MNTAINDIPVIEKELVGDLHFPKESVHTDDIKLKNLKMRLVNATKLGNIAKSKIKIFFEDDQGMKMVETTVWATGDKNIVLKGAVIIPIHRIHEIKMV